MPPARAAGGPPGTLGGDAGEAALIALHKARQGSRRSGIVLTRPQKGLETIQPAVVAVDDRDRVEFRKLLAEENVAFAIPKLLVSRVTLARRPDPSPGWAILYVLLDAPLKTSARGYGPMANSYLTRLIRLTLGGGPDSLHVFFHSPDVDRDAARLAALFSSIDHSGLEKSSGGAQRGASGLAGGIEVPDEFRDLRKLLRRTWVTAEGDLLDELEQAQMNMPLEPFMSKLQRLVELRRSGGTSDADFRLRKEDLMARRRRAAARVGNLLGG